MPTPDSEKPLRAIDFEELPNSLTEDSVILVAKPAPLDEYAVSLRILDRFTSPAERRIIVTTAVSAERTIQQQIFLASPESGRFGVVDATPQNHPSSPFQKYPVVSLPHSVELTRLVLALWELEASMASDSQKTHFGIRSLTPLLADDGLERTISVLKHLIEGRTDSGLVVLGFEYTKHDEDTLSALKEIVDGIVWIEEQTVGSISAEHRRVHAHLDGI
ncbi:hypothetical protein ACFQO4_19070 [Saliphagus sp. GCM10025334]|uniref:DUF7504 family protein n=1 Tax=Natronosalvus caseinilyticus TaxID=2953747 RepID=UPI0028AC26A5|nr:hypothetical protein [Natronosalvus caseinilyticus]